MDPLRHPDLVDISRRLRHHLQMVLEAEQEAAAVTLRRMRTLRDRLLDAEDRREEVRLSRADRRCVNGRVTAVGVDHVVIDTGGNWEYVALVHLVAVRFAEP